MRTAHPVPSVSRRRSPLAPAYYLGRPAELWIDAEDRRHRRNTGGRPAGTWG